LQVTQASRVVVNTVAEEVIAMNVVATEADAIEEVVVATDVKAEEMVVEDVVEITAVEAKEETVNQSNKRIKAR
jgi:hypothetical protein